MATKQVEFASPRRRRLWDAAERVAVQRELAGDTRTANRPYRAGDVIVEWAEVGQETLSGAEGLAGRRNLSDHTAVHAALKRVRNALVRINTSDINALVKDIGLAAKAAERMAARSYQAGYRAGTRKQ